MALGERAKECWFRDIRLLVVVGEIAGKHRRGIWGQGSRDLFLLFPLLTDQQPPPPSPPHPNSGRESKLLTSTAHQPPPNPLKAYCTIFPFFFPHEENGTPEVAFGIEEWRKSQNSKLPFRDEGSFSLHAG